VGPYSREGGLPNPEASPVPLPATSPFISLGALLLLVGAYSAFSRDPNSRPPAGAARLPTVGPFNSGQSFKETGQPFRTNTDV